MQNTIKTRGMGWDGRVVEFSLALDGERESNNLWLESGPGKAKKGGGEANCGECGALEQAVDKGTTGWIWTHDGIGLVAM
jgi:hypothetical protein